MRQEARLSLINRANVSIPFTAEYYKGTDRIIITNNFRVVINRDLTPNEQPLTFEFNPTSPYFYIVWDDKDKSKDDAVQFIMQHIHVDGGDVYKNSNLKKAIFKFENIGKTKSNNVLLNKKALMVSNICNEFTFSKLRDIAFWYSDKIKRKIIDMSAEDIYLALLDLKTGILVNSPDEFLNRYKSPDIEYNVIINKAIMLGVIKSEKGFYFIGQEQIGASFEDLIAYSKINDKMFTTYIKPEVQKRDKLPIDADYKASVAEFMQEEPKKELTVKDVQTPKQAKLEAYQIANDDEDTIRLKAKSLGVKSWQTKKLENLKAELEVLNTQTV